MAGASKTKLFRTLVMVLAFCNCFTNGTWWMSDGTGPPEPDYDSTDDQSSEDSGYGYDDPWPSTGHDYDYTGHHYDYTGHNQDYTGEDHFIRGF